MYFKKADFRKSIEWLTQASNLYPEDSNILKNLGLSYSKLLSSSSTKRELKQGLIWMNKAREAIPTDVNATLNLAVIYAKYDCFRKIDDVS
jgi:hypothetical protein